MLGSAWHANVFIWLLVHPVGLSVSGAVTAAGEVTSTRLPPTTTTVITAGSPRTRRLMLLPRPLSVEQGMKVTPLTFCCWNCFSFFNPPFWEFC